MVNEQTSPLPPAWAAPYLRDGAVAQVDAAVRAAERATSGDIVTMIVRSSGVTGHVFPTLLLGMAAAYLAFDGATHLGSLHGAHPSWSLVHLLLLTLASWGLSRWAFVQRLLTHGADLEVQVLRRAAVEFHEAGLRKTTDGTGILLFVSLAERHAVVLVDPGIAARLPPETWSGVVAKLVAGMRRKDLGHGMADAVGECGRLAAAAFPAGSGAPGGRGEALVFKE